MTGAKLPIPIDFDRFRAGNIVLFGGSHYMVLSLYQKAFELWPTRIEMILVPAPDVDGTWWATMLIRSTCGTARPTE